MAALFQVGIGSSHCALERGIVLTEIRFPFFRRSGRKQAFAGVTWPDDGRPSVGVRANVFTAHIDSSSSRVVTIHASMGPGILKSSNVEVKTN